MPSAGFFFAGVSRTILNYNRPRSLYRSKRMMLKNSWGGGGGRCCLLPWVVQYSLCLGHVFQHSFMAATVAVFLLQLFQLSIVVFTQGATNLNNCNKKQTTLATVNIDHKKAVISIIQWAPYNCCFHAKLELTLSFLLLLFLNFAYPMHR